MAHAKSILVAYDGSDAGRRALDAAADLIAYGSTLAVVGIPTGGSSDPLADASRYLSARHVFARYIDADAQPVEKLVDTAADVGADVIVVAGINGSLDRLVRRAPCDVLVVR